VSQIQSGTVTYSVVQQRLLIETIHPPKPIYFIILSDMRPRTC